MERLYSFRFNFEEQAESRRLNLSKRNRASQLRTRRSAQIKVNPQLPNELSPETYLTSPDQIDSISFLLMPLPTGERVLLRNDGQGTVCISSSGSYIGSFAELLPALSAVECIYNEGQLFARDLLAWQGQSTVSLPAVDRFRMLSENIHSFSVLPVFESSLSTFTGLLNSQDIVFYHTQGQYGVSTYLWTQSSPSNNNVVVLMCSENGELVTSDGKVLHKIPTRHLGNITSHSVKCVVSGNGTIEHIDVVGPAVGEQCFSRSRVLFEAIGSRPTARELEETLASGRLAQDLCVNSSTASSHKPELTEATDLFFK